MVWYDHMYLGKGCSFRGKAVRIKNQITQRRKHSPVWLITLGQSEYTILEMVPSTLLLQKNYPAEELVIIGMADTKKEAMLLVEQIVREVYESCGNCDVAAFMNENKEMQGRGGERQ